MNDQWSGKTFLQALLGELGDAEPLVEERPGRPCCLVAPLIAAPARSDCLVTSSPRSQKLGPTASVKSCFATKYPSGSTSIARLWEWPGTGPKTTLQFVEHVERRLWQGQSRWCVCCS
jgi:hypothetical protein